MDYQETEEKTSVYAELGYYIQPTGKEIRKYNFEESKERHDTQDIKVLKALALLNDPNAEKPKFVGRSEIFDYLNKVTPEAQKNSRGNAMELTSIGRCLNTLAGRNEKKKAKDPKYVAVIVGKGTHVTMGSHKEETFALRSPKEIDADLKSRETGQEVLGI